MSKSHKNSARNIKQKLSLSDDVSFVHPDVPINSPFTVEKGRPDRLNKVLQYFSNFDDYAADLANEKNKKKQAQAKKNLGKIYFGSIKSKVPRIIAENNIKNISNIKA